MGSRFNLIIFIITLVLFASCHAAKHGTTCFVRDSIVYRDVLVPVYVEPDSANIEALLECTEKGQILLKDLNVEHTRNVQLSLKIDSLNVLKSQFRTKHDTIYLRGETKYLDRYNEITKEVEVAKPLTRWQKIKQDVGGMAIGGILVVTVCFIINIIIRIKKSNLKFIK